ncbi:S1 family peptidase [Rudaea cellulosilytica]|uniref:S1 family peptidase n=1 Tax=Rudaea cellulosilytica TaxID=540746 RepID=UPI00037902CB|nr:serine protease [Rudaea cellulosilytica]
MNEQAKKQVVGRVVNDPAANPKEGDTLGFQPISVTLLPKNATVVMENIDAFDGAVLSFHFADADEHNVEGSAIIVAPGIALTAKHVIKSHLDRLMKGERHAMCIGIAKSGMNVWTVKKMTILTDVDIVILGLELNSAMPPERTFRQAIVSTRLPKIGDRLQIVGFRANSATRSMNNGERGYGVDAMLLVSAGVVKERYPQGRDKAMLPWPVLEVDCPSWGGMSGGPVFDEGGHLIGLLCSSLELEDGDGVSYVSLLWQALTAKFEGGWPAQAFEGKRTLLELAPQICPIVRPEAISYTLDELTGRVTTHYTPWE